LERIGSHWTDFHESRYLGIFRKHVKKIQVSLKTNTNNGHFRWKPLHIFEQISLISS